MKKLLAILLVVATLFCIAACDNGDTDTTTTTVTQDSTTTTTTTKQDDTTTTTTVGGSDTTTTTVDESTTATTIENTTTTTKKEETTVDNGPKPINGVDPTDSNNQNKVVNGVFTSSNGGIQLSVPGFQTYNLQSISMVLEGFDGTVGTNAICVAVYPKGSDNYDSATAFENKTQADFESVLQLPIDSFTKTKLQGYTCYKAVTTPEVTYGDANGNPRSFYRVWVFQTENAKYFINFMQAPDAFQNKGWSNPDMAPVAAQIMNSIVIFD